MNSRFSHLVWLGAGTASEPTNLLNTAEQVTLIEARETACELLRKQHTESNIDIKQQLVDVASERAQFTEYNLVEYSAIAPATGLKALFPGLRKTGTEQLTSIAITDAIADLHLSGTNNLLIIDIPDSNLALLQALQQRDQISLFKNIHMHTALEPLYKDSSTRADVISFMQSTGYELLQENNQDPELPWLTFFVNPLWLTLHTTRQELATERQAKDGLAKELENANLDRAAQQQAKDNLAKELERANLDRAAQQQAKDKLTKELEKAKQEFATQQQAKDNLAKELEKSKKELDSQKKAEDNLKKELEEIKQELTSQIKTKEKLSKEILTITQELTDQVEITENLKKDVDAKTKNEEKLESEKRQIESKIKDIESKSKAENEKITSKLQLEFDQLSKTAANRKDLVLKLEKENTALIEENKKLAKKQITLEQELIKADAQITLIKDLFLK